MRRITLLLALWAIASASIAEFRHPDLLSFEQSTEPAQAIRSSLSLSAMHYKHGSHSLCWQWSRKNAQLTINRPVAYEANKRHSKDNSIYTFVFWIYNPVPADQSIRVEFLKQGRVCCWFDYGLNFKGWHGAWVAFKRDMQGRPEEGMDQMRITAPEGMKKGVLYFDHVILSSLQDSRQHTADLSAPFINPHTTNHWLTLLRSWNEEIEGIEAGMRPRDLRDIQTIERRLDQLLLTRKKLPVSQLGTRVAAWDIRQNADGTTKGRPLFFERFGETYEHMGGGAYAQEIGDMGLAGFNALMLDLAQTCRNTSGEDSVQCAQWFISLLRHSLDQGLHAGSAMGTLHHLGYSMRDYYMAVYLMRDVINDAGLKQEVQQASEWFSGAGEMKHRPTSPGMDMDSFNTNLTGRLVSVLLLDDNERRAQYLHCFTRWFDNGLQYSDGLSGSFKPDGTAFHHCNHYPAYAIGGMRGAVNGLWLLHRTNFRVGEQAHANLRQAVMAMRIYCNLTHWPVSLCGRHPDGKGSLQPTTFARLAECGTPDGKERIDIEVAQAYKRLTREHPTKKFDSRNLMPEATPEGNWAFPYSCLDIHRRDEWMVAIKGHSRYIWNTEIYRGCNLYGRYLNYGNIQVMMPGQSGFSHDGWDWNHFPGTTSTVLPMANLRADIGNIGDDSGYEEMLQSDESFCNGLSLNGQGIWGMKLHSHDKYDGTLRARKSVFCFDNRVICLGSDIENQTDAETVTTLYQEPADSLAAPAELTGQGNITRIRTRRGIDYYVAGGKVQATHSLQHSLHQKTGQPTQGWFDKAWICHGTHPHGSSYEYMMLIHGTEQQREQATSSYQVMEQSSDVHAVRDLISNTTGYVLFEPHAAFDNSQPCLVMTRPTSDGLLMAVSDPDLHLYEGPADEQYDENGHRRERIIYGYSWKDDPSRVSIIRLTLCGTYQLARPTDNVSLQQSDGHTTISITCQHGMGREFTLIEAEN